MFRSGIVDWQIFPAVLPVCVSVLTPALAMAADAKENADKAERFLKAQARLMEQEMDKPTPLQESKEGRLKVGAARE